MIQEMDTASLFATNLWQDFTGVGGVPAVRWIGHDSGKLALVTDPLGPTLEDLHNSHCRHELPPIDLVATQLITRIQMMHQHSLAHGTLRPSSFCLGYYEWQSSHILLCDFHFTPLKKAFVDDLRQIGTILAYLYGDARDWSKFVDRSVPEKFKNAPAEIQKYMDRVNTPSPIDYASLRDMFTVKQGAPRFSSAVCADRSCLYEKLYSCLRRIGITVEHPMTSWSESTGTALLQSQSELLSIYLVLLARDSKPRSCRAHDLKHRFWRDIQWLLKLAECGPVTFRTEIVGRIYQFMTVLAELVPNNRQFWLEKLLNLAKQQMSIAGSPKGWRKAALHWNDEVVNLRGMNALFRDADLVDFSLSQLG
jgi:hypothetical protein